MDFREVDTTIPRFRDNPSEAFVRCFYCHLPLAFESNGVGWIHSGGSAQALRCKECGWGGAPRPSPVLCPSCGIGTLRASHLAKPGRS
jgi:hypothetical protein